MLRTWKVSNFKSIKEMREPLEFAPLTIFCGTNSSGKSSLLQSILLFKQTLQKKEITEPRMALNGGLVKLGTFDDVITDGANGVISCSFQIDDYEYGDTKEGDCYNHVADILANKINPKTSMKHTIDFSNSNNEFRDSIGNLYPHICSIAMINLLDNEKICFSKLDTAGLTENEYEKLNEKTNNFFCNKLYYVGPLRRDPRENSDTTSQYKGVGYMGEYSAECYVLYSHKWKMYPYLFGDENFDKITADNKIKTILHNLAGGGLKNHIDCDILKTSLFEWLRYIGIADYFDYRDDDLFDEDEEQWEDRCNALDTNENGELVIQQGNKRLLKNVGFGVSQVLPIILQCILADPGSTIIIEQPELHLHPKMQSRLADFFLAMSLLGKQIIIETHSEYIIDKLRLRIVQAPSATPINDKVAIYFAEKNDGNSEFRRIHINEYSVMSEWPEGFFEESMQIAREILFAARQKEKGSGASEADND
jgi:predicted ATPase